MVAARIAAIIVLVGLSEAASAASVATWVNAAGVDTGTCSRADPCRTIQFAQGRTRPEGTINVVGAGAFGPIHITKALSINADGGGVAVLNGKVSCPEYLGSFQATVCLGNRRVTLRGLTIDGQNGVAVAAPYGSLVVENTTIRNSSIAVSAYAAPDIGSYQQTLVLYNVSLIENKDGIRLSHGDGTLNATIVNTTISGDGKGAGLDVSSQPNLQYNVSVEKSTIVNNAVGIDMSGADASAVVRLSDSLITANKTGIKRGSFGAIVESYGNNRIHGNTTNGDPSAVIPLR